MGKDTEIQWAHHTFNTHWGCEKVSAACRSCYAETFSKRLGLKLWGGDDTQRRFFGDKHWNEPLKWNRAARAAGERHRVFCASMADVFEDRRDLDETRVRLFKLIEATPDLDWMLLSKRWGIADIEGMLPPSWREAWPANAWAGATVEDKEQAAIRMPALRATRAPIRFLSAEPLLEDLGDIDLTGIHLVIIGGESGHRARPLDLEAVDSLIRRTWAARAWPFVKQMGEAWANAHGAKDSHGGDPAEWEPRFRMREMPRTATPKPAQRSLLA
jgi:protein gp37